MGTRKPIAKGTTAIRAKAKTEQPKSAVAQRVQRHRDILRAKGLRQVTLWVPDTRDPAFIAEYRHQVRTIGGDPRERELLARMSEIADRRGWV